MINASSDLIPYTKNVYIYTEFNLATLLRMVKDRNQILAIIDFRISEEDFEFCFHKICHLKKKKLNEYKNFLSDTPVWCIGFVTVIG